jgi:hypothetical protein
MESRTNSVKYINVLRNYQMIKLWLLGKARKERIPNFEKQYKELLGYDSITFHYQGKSYTFDRKTIEEKAVGPSKHCERCAGLQLELDSLKLHLKEKPTKPNLQVVLRDYIQHNYKRTYQRMYPRRKLFCDLNAFLTKYDAHISHQSDELWKWVVNEVLEDKSKQKRFFKLRKIN